MATITRNRPVPVEDTFTIEVSAKEYDVLLYGLYELVRTLGPSSSVGPHAKVLYEQMLSIRG